MLEQLLSLPIDKKIGQLFFISLAGPELDSAAVEIFEEVSPGGVCLFARNVRSGEQVRQLLDEIRRKCPVEPFLSLDQEGGLVDRLRRIATPMPAANYIKSAEDAAQLAEYTAGVISQLGFNMNFAPVVDVIDDRRKDFSNGLHSRAFGSSKEEVVELAGVYLERLQALGVIGCLKHFPGLGGAEKDAHEVLPRVNLTDKELLENDLWPYFRLFESAKVRAVMIAHAAYPLSDLQETDQNGKLKPSSLSFNFVEKLLRGKLGFQGLAITDDLEMGAITNNYGIGEACRMALGAGLDQLAICSSYEAIRAGFQAVREAFEVGLLREEQIDKSLQRIAAVKSQMSRPLPFDPHRLGELSNSIAALNTKVQYSYGG